MFNKLDMELRRSARKFLTRRPVEPAAALADMAHSDYAPLPADFYGDGGAVAALEQRVAGLVGKPAGLFFMKGMIALLSVLRRYAEARRSPWIALHPLSHIDYDEENAVEHLHRLQLLRVGKVGPFTATDLAQLQEQPACVVVELPLRRAGYLLPSWEQLAAISQWCRDRGVPWYGRSLAEIAALADSIYVSFYKGLGGLAGCVVVGEPDFLASLKPWKTRHGGNLFAGYPYAISALIGLDRHLPQQPLYVRRARALAPAVAAVPSFQVYPVPPHVNAFAIVMPGRPDQLAEHNRAFAKDTGIWLFNGFVEGPQPETSIAEVVIGDSCEDFTDDEAVGWLRQFADRITAR